jgi:hypothetical protein
MGSLSIDGPALDGVDEGGSTEIIYKVTHNIDTHVLNRTGMVASVSVRDVTHNIAHVRKVVFSFGTFFFYCLCFNDSYIAKLSCRCMKVREGIRCLIYNM